jgi:hypothetical protein
MVSQKSTESDLGWATIRYRPVGGQVIWELCSDARGNDS